MMYISSFIRVLSLVLAIVVSLSGISLPAYFALAKPASLQMRLVTGPAANSGLLQSGCSESNASVKNGPLQHNRAIAFLSKFDALRPTFPIIVPLYDTTILPVPFYKQEQNYLYKEHLRAFLPQKKPEDC